MRSGKTNTWRGRIQPKRAKCPRPECGRRGLGPVRTLLLNTGVLLTYRTCRYCHHMEEVMSSLTKSPSSDSAGEKR